MDAIKAGVEKAKEACAGIEDKVDKANDPTKSTSSRVDAALDAGKAQVKEQEHREKAECHKEKHELKH